MDREERAIRSQSSAIDGWAGPVERSLGLVDGQARPAASGPLTHAGWTIEYGPNGPP